MAKTTRYAELMEQLKAAKTEAEKEEMASQIKALKTYEDAYRYHARQMELLSGASWVNYYLIYLRGTKDNNINFDGLRKVLLMVTPEAKDEKTSQPLSTNGFKPRQNGDVKFPTPKAGCFRLNNPARGRKQRQSSSSRTSRRGVQ